MRLGGVHGAVRSAIPCALPSRNIVKASDHPRLEPGSEPQTTTCESAKLGELAICGGEVGADRLSATEQGQPRRRGSNAVREPPQESDTGLALERRESEG